MARLNLQIKPLTLIKIIPKYISQNIELKKNCFKFIKIIFRFVKKKDLIWFKDIIKDMNSNIN